MSACARAIVRFRVVHLIAVRQMNDLFGIVRLLVEREDDRVGDDVVDEVRPCRAGKSEIAHLDRRRTKCQDAEARMLGMTVQVDRDVDLKIVDELRDLLVALAF